MSFHAEVINPWIDSFIYFLAKRVTGFIFSFRAGYIIYYSTNVNAEVHDWVIEPVVGNRLTHQIQELTLDTTYYFKIQARNSKGMGPMSEAVHFRTPKSKLEDKHPVNDKDQMYDKQCGTLMRQRQCFHAWTLLR